jgi:hypothetical protein
MSRSLSEKYIDDVELFIKNNNPSQMLPAISECYRNQAIEDWNYINDSSTPNTTYLQFASSAMGMNSYGFYKSKSGKIYLLSAFVNSLSYYCIIDSQWEFLRSLSDVITVNSDLEQD